VAEPRVQPLRVSGAASLVTRGAPVPAASLGPPAASLREHPLHALERASASCHVCAHTLIYIYIYIYIYIWRLHLAADSHLLPWCASIFTAPGTRESGPRHPGRLSAWAHLPPFPPQAVSLSEAMLVVVCLLPACRLIQLVSAGCQPGLAPFGIAWVPICFMP
jgi:hypothetical protein